MQNPRGEEGKAMNKVDLSIMRIAAFEWRLDGWGIGL
jgi:hypothetical protein